MASHNLKKVLADAECLLQHHSPAFDITDEERQVAKEHAELMLSLIAMCKGNKKEFVKSMANFYALPEAFVQLQRNNTGPSESEFPGETTAFQEQEQEEALEAFDAQFGGFHRQNQIKQMVNAACYGLLGENETVFGKILDFRRRVASLMPWNWEKIEKPKEKELTLRMPLGMDVETALELVVSQSFCKVCICNDLQNGIMSLHLVEDTNVEDVRTELEEIGFTIVGEASEVEKERLSLGKKIKRIFGKNK